MAKIMRQVLAVLEAGMQSRLHVGAQLFASLAGTTAADIALGLSAPGRPMTPDSMMTWLSCSKIATSILFARIWEEGLVDLDEPIAAHLPEFAGGGKDAITIRHVWTHTCGLLNVEQKLFPARYDQGHAANIALICRARIDRGVTPGTRAGYQTSVVALLLAEIIQRKRGRDFRELIRDEVFVPLGMTDSWLGMPADTVAAYGERLGQTFDTSGPEPKPGSWAPDTPRELAHLMPGGNGRGPMHELARLLELLRCRGTLGGARILAPATVEALTARQRCGLYDESWDLVLDWSLGLTLDSRMHHGGATHLYGYGRHASPRTFGHSGFRTTTAFCDPDRGLVVACSWNGMVADDDIHSARQNALCEAIYQDLGLA
jgi:CubicO group peptidase (beta-lactamase class C family)